jgi:cytochrome P450
MPADPRQRGTELDEIHSHRGPDGDAGLNVAGVPVAADERELRAAPLDILASAREEHGNLFAIRSDGPIFSRARGCEHVLCALGGELQREVLTDVETFAMPVSAARRLRLGERLVNLNRSLHSMTPPQHGAHKNLIAGLLRRYAVEREDRPMQAALASVAGDWHAGTTFGLLERSRELALRMAIVTLFGDDEGAHLARLLQTYFFLRREVTSPLVVHDETARSALRRAGRAADAALRSFIRRIRLHGTTQAGLFASIVTAGSEDGYAFSEDEIAGHLNILFVSTTEPIAITLTWTLLVLSQLPAFRHGIRDDMHGKGEIDRVVRESLRLFPPNAFMVRVTSRPATLGGVTLPAGCEIILCPFLSHRDESVFARPNVFAPDRWKTLGELPYQYIPFGAGGHACVGKALALRAVTSALAFLLARYDLVLDGDQQIDWRLHIQFMPRPDPVVTVVPADASPARVPGVLGGPVAEMMVLDRDQLRAPR